MTIRKQIMVGMMGTGKSSFVVALYHVVESGEVVQSLQLTELADERKYLVEKRDEWLGCIEFDRTKLGKEQVLTLKLKDPSTQRVVDLTLPDVSGETFRDQWEHRRTTKIFDDLARESDGVLLFVHPETIKDGIRINSVKEVAEVLEDEAEVEKDDFKEGDTTSKNEDLIESNTAVDWHPSFAPTQVKLVEVLQLLLREPHVYPIQRIALIVSAWDLVKSQYASPREWITKRLPLLNQFLLSNHDRVSVKFFGISAQGGSLGADNSAMLSKGRQSERIDVATDKPGEYHEHDITAPVKWLMEDNE